MPRWPPSPRVRIDYPAVWAVKRAVLEACFEAFARRPATTPAWPTSTASWPQGGERLRRFAAFEAIAATRPGVPWQRWPEELRRPDDPGVARFAARHAREVDFAAYLQWVADRQLAQAAARRGRAARASASTATSPWAPRPTGRRPGPRRPRSRAASRSARRPTRSAPRDRCGTCRRRCPTRWPPAAARAFARLIAANARHAGALRIDHVMGLARLFWVPDGATADRGRLRPLPARGPPRRARAGEPARALPRRRRGPRHGGRGLSRAARCGRRALLPRAVVRARRRARSARRAATRPTPPPASRRTTCRRSAAGGTAPTSTSGARWASPGTDETAAAAPRGEAQRPAPARADALAGRRRSARFAWTRIRPAGDAVAQALHRFIGATPCALALVQADDLSGEDRRSTCPEPTASARTGGAGSASTRQDLWNTPVGAQAARDLAAARGPAD